MSDYDRLNTPSVRDSRAPPVEEGDVVEVEVTDTGDKGDGVARVENFVLFVEDADEGYTGKVEVESVGDKFGFAEKVVD